MLKFKEFVTEVFHSMPNVKKFIGGREAVTVYRNPDSKELKHISADHGSARAFFHNGDVYAWHSGVLHHDMKNHIDSPGIEKAHHLEIHTNQKYIHVMPVIPRDHKGNLSNIDRAAVTDVTNSDYIKKRFKGYTVGGGMADDVKL